jgi:hypothetical protein
MNRLCPPCSRGPADPDLHAKSMRVGIAIGGPRPRPRPVHHGDAVRCAGAQPQIGVRKVARPQTLPGAKTMRTTWNRP